MNMQMKNPIMKYENMKNMKSKQLCNLMHTKKQISYAVYCYKCANQR